MPNAFLERLRVSSDRTKRVWIAAVGGTLALLCVALWILYRTSVAPYGTGGAGEQQKGVGVAESVRNLRDSFGNEWGKMKASVGNVWQTETPPNQ